jgi:hypothetical protein
MLLSLVSLLSLASLSQSLDDDVAFFASNRADEHLDATPRSFAPLAHLHDTMRSAIDLSATWALQLLDSLSRRAQPTVFRKVVHLDAASDSEVGGQVRKRQTAGAPAKAAPKLSAALVAQAQQANEAYVDAPEYLGCFADRYDNGSADFEFSVAFDELLEATVPGCARICQRQALGAYPYIGVRGNRCFCGRQFGAYGPLSSPYCRTRCAGDRYLYDCEATPAELAIARNVTPAQADLLFPRSAPELWCGGGAADDVPQPRTNRTLCTLRTPRPTPVPSPTPATNPNVQFGVDFSDFGYGAYTGARNSVYRAAPLRACGIGVATVTSLPVNTCSLARRCTLDTLVCNGTLVDDVGGYAKPLQLCVVRSLLCRDDDDDANATTTLAQRVQSQLGRLVGGGGGGDPFPAQYNLFVEQDHRDCTVRELSCDGVRVLPDQFFGDRSRCDVRVRCDRGRVEYGYDAFGWRCANETLLCPPDSASNSSCIVREVGCDAIDPPRFVYRGAAARPAANATSAPTPAPTPAPLCVKYAQPTLSAATQVPCAPACVTPVSVTTCRCPTDRFGDRCQYRRRMECDAAVRAPAPECRQPTRLRDELLSADRACFSVPENSNISFSYRLACEFADVPTQQLPAFLRRLLIAAADLGVPAAQGALDGIMDNRTAALEALLEQFNETVYRVGADPRNAIDETFSYFVLKRGAFALSEPPFWHLNEKLFDMMQLLDDSQVVGVALSADAMRGDALVTVNRSLADVPQRFRTASRLYAELRWSTLWGVPPNGTESKRVLRRHFIDVEPSRSDVGSTVDLSVSGTVIGAVVGVAAVLIVLLVTVLLCIRRRRLTYQRR